MAVRSIRGVRSKRVIKPKVWIPPQYTAVYKLTVTRKDGTVDDISNIAHIIEIEDGVTDTIGNFLFEVWDLDETYKNAWTGTEIVRYYSDYSSSADTLRFRGKIEKVSHQGMKLQVTGRSDSSDYMELTVTQQYTEIECSVILKDLISKYGSGFTDNNVEISTTNLTVNWYQKPFWDCVQELCSAAGFDAYVDKDLDFNFFESGSRVNEGEAIVHDYNLVEVGDFADDLSLIKNRIIIYGAEQESTQVLYTAEDESSQTNYGLKEEIISDANITDETQAKEFGDHILTEKKDPPQIGELTGVLLATIQPGEKINLSSPTDDIVPGLYAIISYKHKIDSNGQFTSVRISKEPRRMTHVFKDIVERANVGQETTINPFEMRFSYNFLFDSDSGAHVSTEITNGVLKLTTGQSSGNWTSAAKVLTTNITEAYITVFGETLTGATFEISGDDGISYQSIDDKEKINVDTATGTNLRVRVTFSDADTQIDSLSILYK